MSNRDVSDYSSPAVLSDCPGLEPTPDDVTCAVIDFYMHGTATDAASEALWCDDLVGTIDWGTDIVDADLDAVVRHLGMPEATPVGSDGHHHHRDGDAHHRSECPCGGCRADREDPDPFLDDRAARRRELRRRSDVHSRYRNRVGRGSEQDPGPRNYRPGRAPRRAGDRR